MRINIRKICVLLAAALLLAAIIPAAAGAEGAQILVIDTHNRYAGMNKTWGEGYLPSVSGGTAKVVLPLLLNPAAGAASIAGDSISVRPDFGDAASSPFRFDNIEAKVKRASHAVNGGAKTVQAWLLSFSFALERHRVNGRYPLTFHVSYTLADGTAGAQDFTVYVTIRDGIDPNATPKPDPTPAPTPKPPPQPRLIVSRYAVEPAVVQAGQGLTISFDVKNTSDVLGVRNIKITLKGEGTDLEPAGGSNTLYLDNLAKSAAATLSFGMKARYDAEPKPQKVSVSIDYEDGNGTAYTAADEILVQVSQPLRIEFDKPNFPAQVSAGDTVPLSLNVFNMGKSALNNVLCKVSAPGLLPEGSAFLGNMEPGASKTAEIYVYVGSRDMSLDKDGNIARDASVTELYGDTAGTVNVTYEDEFGQSYSAQVALETKIGEPSEPAVTAPPADASAETGQWWISVAIGGAIVAGAAVAIMLMRRRRAKEAAGDDEAG